MEKIEQVKIEEFHNDSKGSSKHEIQIEEVNLDNTLRAGGLNSRSPERSGTTPIEKTTKATDISKETRPKSGTVILPEDHSKAAHTSKSFSLSKSCVNQKEVVDIKGPISNEIFFSIKNTPVTDDYLIGKLLGEGSYGQVKLVIHKRNGFERAIKIIRKQELPEEEKKNLLKEVQILKGLDHPNIIKLFDMYEDQIYFYLVTEFCSGGELFDRIQKINCFTEKDAAKYIKQLLSAITYLHERNIVHRDLKAENLLFENENEDANMKLIDFGVSSEILKGAKLKETLGTPYYIAPEVLLQSYDEKCDVWSCGVILYILLCGYPPFNGADDNEILENVKKGEFCFYGNLIVLTF